MRNNREREQWIDYIKIFACIFVVLGHLFQSMVRAKLLGDTGLYRWFDKTVYCFHVQLFFICSGYVYSRYKSVTTLSTWKDNVLRKLWELGIPYFTFTLATWLLKYAFSSEVNVKNNGLLETLFVSPASPYWFLYVLFVFFLLVPTLKGRRLHVLFTASVILECITFDMTAHDIWYKLFANLFWFASGMLLGTCELRPFSGSRKLLLCGFAGFFVFLLSSVIIYITIGFEPVLEFFLGFTACGSVMLVFLAAFGKRSSRLLNRISGYTMPVFLMHTLCASVARTVLIKVGIRNGLIHVLCGLVVSFLGPVIITEILQRIWKLDFIIYPARYYPWRNRRKDSVK